MKKKIKAYKRRDNIAGYVMLAPWLFGFVLMYFLPMLISIYYSFTDYNLLNDAKVIGFDNYVRIFTNDDTFWQALKVTFIYTIFLVPLRLAFALVVAMLLNTKPVVVSFSPSFDLNGRIHNEGKELNASRKQNVARAGSGVHCGSRVGNLSSCRQSNAIYLDSVQIHNVASAREHSH